MICRCLLILSLALLGSLPSGARLDDAASREIASLPPAPLDYLYDEHGLLERHPERLAAIKNRLHSFQEEYGYPVYVAVYGGLITSNPRRRANYLFDKWVGEGRDGAVFVYNSDSYVYELVLPRGNLSSFEQGDEFRSRLTEYHVGPIDRELATTLDGVEDRVDYLDRATEILCQRLGEILSTEDQKEAGGHTFSFVAVFLTLAALITLVGLYLGRRMRRIDDRIRERFYLPDVTVASRLGGPFCGGRISIVDYSGDSSAPRS